MTGVQTCALPISQWHRNCESRKAGRLSQASFKLSTNNISATNEHGRKKIEADLNILLFKANGSYENDRQVSLYKEEDHNWSVEVEFYPLNEYGKKNNNPLILDKTKSTSKNMIIYGAVGIIILLIGIIIALF